MNASLGQLIRLEIINSAKNMLEQNAKINEVAYSLVRQELSSDIYKRRYFSSDQGGKPELCLSIMHLCPDIRRRGGFFQRRAEGKEQVYGGQDLVLVAQGFEEANHFSSFFKHYTGVAPSEFK